MTFWSVLWSVDASKSQKRAKHFEQLFSAQKEAFRELSIAYAFQIKDSLINATPDFMLILGCHEQSEVPTELMEKVSKAHNLETWNEFFTHIEFHNDTFTHPFEGIDGQTYCLNARCQEGVLFMWLSVIKSPHDEYILARKMIDNVPIALWYRNKKLQVNHCNLVYAGALESTKTDVANQNIELYPAKRSGSPYQLTLKAIETGKRQVQRIHAVISGSRRYLEIGVVPFANGESMGYAFDLTEVEGLQRDLEKHIDSQKEIMEHLSTPIAVFGQDTRLMFFNQAYARIFSYDEKWLATKPTLGDILEDLRTRRKLPEYANFQQHKKDRINLFKTLLNPIQELLHQPDGQVLRLFISPHPQGGMVYIFEDVTDKIVLERQFNTLSAVQKETLDNLYEGIVVFGSDLKLRLLNKSFAKLMGILDREWFLGKSLHEVMQVEIPLLYEDKEHFQRQLLTMFEKRHVSENLIQLKGGVWIRYTYIPLPDGSHLMSVLNVTDTIKFQDALKERNRLLEEVDEVKSRFIKHVSHEIKNPLLHIQNLALQLCEGELSENIKKRDDFLQEILTSSETMLALMTDMTDLADIEAGQLTLMPSDVKTSKFIKGVVNLVAGKASEQGIEILIRNESKIDQFRGDERRLKQAFFNVLTNAIKYKPQKGKLTFKVEHVENTQGSLLVFSVLDTGFRVKKSTLKKSHGTEQDVRQMFSSELGLTLVQRIIDLHGGWISFETIGEGIEEKMNVSCHLPYYSTSNEVKQVPEIIAQSA